MNCLPIHLHLHSSLLITQLGGGDPNSGIGYNYIPGSTLRGAVISRYLEGKAIDAADQEFRHLFLDSAVRFLNGYPVARNGQRTLPIPLSWQQPKDAGKDAPVHDWALGMPTVNQDKAWKGVGGHGFCYLHHSAQAETAKPEMQINIHIAREDRQRPTAGNATIFRYDALSQGQTFAALIIADDAADLAMIKEHLPHGARLPMGRSRSAGYGWVEVRYPANESDASLQAPTAEWVVEPQANIDAAPPKQLIVTLLSDTLIQEPATGAYVADLYPVVGARASERFVRLHKVGGFNRKWNLPLPQAEAMVAGSVFVYDYSIELATKLAGLSESGIGNRRAEGFGRIAVNWQSAPAITLVTKETLPASKLANKTGDQAAVTIDDHHPLAMQMVTRMARSELDRLLLQAINLNAIERRGLRNAQLARIRVVARHALESQHLTAAAQAKRIHRLEHFLNTVKESARNQLQRGRIPRPHTDDETQENEPLPQSGTGDKTRKSEPYYDWLMRLARTPETVWTILAVPPQLPGIGPVKADLTPALAIEYALRLIDGIAQLATREENHE